MMEMTKLISEDQALREKDEDDLPQISSIPDNPADLNAWLDGLSAQRLTRFSKSILNSIMSDNGDAEEKELLRRVYWHIVEVLAHLTAHDQ